MVTNTFMFELSETIWTGLYSLIGQYSDSQLFPDAQECQLKIVMVGM